MRLRLLGIVVVLSLGCTRPRTCVDIPSSDNSIATAAHFVEEGCQGGGVTWAAILAAGAPSGVDFDDEADAVRVCGPPSDVEAVQRRHDELNRDVIALRRALAATPPHLAECD